jgi:hypothetical protein
VRIRWAFGALVVVDLSASAGAVLARTWSGLGPGKSEESEMSWSASVLAAEHRRKSLRKQHHAEQSRHGRKAGDSGLAGPLCRPCCVISPWTLSAAGPSILIPGWNGILTKGGVGCYKIVSRVLEKRRGIESSR